MRKYKSFIRWAGGKAWLIPFVHKLIDGLNYNNYFEPFMGGAAVFFSMETQHQCYLSDINQELIDTFCTLRDNCQDVITLLQQYRPDENSYYRIRDLEPTSLVEKAARFLYLNKYSFNGLYRVNRKGKYNVPYGKRQPPIDYEVLVSASKKLQGVEITRRDFIDVKPMIKKEDLFFLDPPYAVGNGEKTFIGYNSKLFRLEDQYKLAELIDEINEKQAYYILTNAYHPTIEDIFATKGRKVTLERSSTIGGVNSYRGKVSEYIFTNIPGRDKSDE